MVQQATALVWEGSGEEVAALIGQTYAGQTVRVIVEADDAALLAPPFTVRDAAHLQQLLMEGMDGPRYPVTDDTFDARKAEVRRRLASLPTAP